MLVFNVACSAYTQNYYNFESKTHYIELPTVVIDLVDGNPTQQELYIQQNMVRSRLTGLYISEEAANRRPFALVFNNDQRALPQSGIGLADIVYEVLAEGITTRLIAVFQGGGYELERVGPLRSTRQYFAYIPSEHDAIFVHHGGSIAGYNAIRSLDINAIDGMTFDGSTIWRDAQRRQTRGLEHSSYTNIESLISRSELLGFSLVQNSDVQPIFSFFDEPTRLSHRTANVVHIPFAGSNTTVFTYNADTGLYYKQSFGQDFMDYETNNQVAVANVIVQITNISVIPNDAEGRRNVDMVGEGRGYLISYGTYMPITWRKLSANVPTQWFDENGQRLRLNPGQSWVSVISSNPTIE